MKNVLVGRRKRRGRTKGFKQPLAVRKAIGKKMEGNRNAKKKKRKRRKR